MSGRVAIFAGAVEDALSLLDDFVQRVQGVVITRSDRFFCTALGPALWHVGVSEAMVADLGAIAAGFLDMQSKGRSAMNENQQLRLELEHSQELRAQLVESYGESVRLLQERVEQLREEMEKSRLAETATAESEEKLRTTLNSIGDAVIATDTDGNITRMNPVAESLTGYSIEEASGKPLAEVFKIVCSTSGEPALNPVDDVMAHGHIVGLANHAKLIAKDGRGYQISDSAAPIKDKKGVMTGVVLVFQDVTETYALQKQYRQMAFLVQSAANPTVMADLDGILTYVNPAFLDTWGYESEDEVLGRSLTDFWMVADCFEKILETPSNSEPVHDEAEARRRDGSLFPAQLSAALVNDTDGKPVSMTCSSVDTTERKQAEARIRELNQGLERRVAERTAQLAAANKELEAFCYSVSHDLRAPLRAIDGFTHILVDDYLAKSDDECRRLCLVIRDRTQKMGRLIDDLLAFSRLNRAELRMSLINMEALLNSVFREITSLETKGPVDLHLDPIPAVAGDPALMRQVWLNLLSNAVKFSSTRERAIIRVSSKQENHEQIYSVSDNGAGFDTRYADKLFGVFQRLHSEREFEGTGVGLAIVQRIVQRHGGRVWAEAKVDQGATFYFALPMMGH